MRNESGFFSLPCLKLMRAIFRLDVRETRSAAGIAVGRWERLEYARPGPESNPGSTSHPRPGRRFKLASSKSMRDDFQPPPPKRQESQVGHDAAGVKHGLRPEVRIFFDGKVGELKAVAGAASAA